ncbi:MAG: oxidation resistance protein 1 [Geoglossum umbratile]|nr:MAG: oxidation resistance protein 1 [Geoglossum umbratile]
MPSLSTPFDDGVSGVFTPPRRYVSPFQPPPLSPLVLKGYKSDTPASAQLLSRALAEEIRLLIPPILQLVEDWSLVYSLEQDGVSLATLYNKCENLQGGKGGFVLVVRDESGGVFGSFLTNPPSPGPHYYGTGECFLWKASIISPLNNLPPPPSSDTTNMTRSTTISNGNGALVPPAPSNGAPQSGQTTPGYLRFKAFPYSGMNDYMILCDHSFLSVGGGDGHYGLWLDDIFEKGISSRCPTFGNEPLSDVGEKFDILGVELWHIG